MGRRNYGLDRQICRRSEQTVSSRVQRQSRIECPRCGGPRFKVGKTGDAHECDCAKPEECRLCEGRGWREISGESVKCICEGGPDLQAREFPAHTRARADGRETSLQAAESVVLTLNAAQWQVLNALRSIGPAIHQKIVEAVRARGHTQSSSGIRTRTAELVEIGSVKDSGRKAKTEAGFNAVVWEAILLTRSEATE